MSHGASFLKKLDEFATDISLFISAGVVEPLEKKPGRGFILAFPPQANQSWLKRPLSGTAACDTVAMSGIRKP
jgi:hypothetical protein